MAPGKPVLATLFFALIGGLVISSCTIRLPGMPTSALQGEFNLTKGTHWVYLDSEYQPAPSDPTQVITAQYQLIQTVADISRVNGLIIVHVQSEQKPVQVPASWMPCSPPGDFWYIIKGRQVFKSNASVDIATVDTDMLLLAYDFPLSVNQSWCPLQVDLKDPRHMPITNCANAGKQTVLQQSAYQVPAGKFENCFRIDQAYNDGDTIQWFCQNIDVVETKFDHSGIRFGFKQELTGYDQGSQ